MTLELNMVECLQGGLYMVVKRAASKALKKGIKSAAKSRKKLPVEERGMKSHNDQWNKTVNKLLRQQAKEQ